MANDLFMSLQWPSAHAVLAETLWLSNFNTIKQL